MWRLHRASLFEDAADLGVFAFGVFAHHGEVNVCGGLAFERAQIFSVEFDRAEINVQVQTEAQTEDDRALDQPHFHCGVTDRAEKDRVQRFPFFDHFLWHEFFGLEIMRARIRILDEVALEALSDGSQNLQRFVRDLGTDPVSRDDADVVCFH